MSQIDQFLAALKRSLKAKNILYRDLAKALNLSESSVKRILSSKSLSLERLEEICRVADLSFSEVVEAANLEDSQQTTFLSDEQEEALAENARLLHYYMMLYEGKTPQKIEREYVINTTESKKFLFQLDRLNLIELHPRDKVKVRRHGFIRFRRDGPVGKALFAQTKASYLNYDFKPDDFSFMRFTFSRLTAGALAKFKARLEKLIGELQEEARFEQHSNVPGGEDMGLLMAFRPWKYSYMDALKKKE